MKNSIVLLIGLLLLISDPAHCTKKEIRNNPDAEISLQIGCTPDLYSLTERWADEFCKLYPDVRIEVTRWNETSASVPLDFSGHSALISNWHPATENQSVWHVVVGRDVTVPVINAENPLLEEIYQQGVSPEKITQSFTNPASRHWGTLTGNKENFPVQFYMIDDASIHSGMARWLGMDPFMLDGKKVENSEALISAVEDAPYSIGFCKITDIIDPERQIISDRIKVLPIDRNNNGKIDYMEDVYGDLYSFSRAVWTGKYPKAMVNNLYFISPVKPSDETEKAFFKWILTGGQHFLDTYGLSGLLHAERQTKMNLVDDQEFNLIAAGEKRDTPLWLWFIIISFPLAVFTVIFANIRQVSEADRKESLAEAFRTAPAINERMIDVPRGIYYDKSHTWTYMEQNGQVRLGIDDFLQHITGPVTRIRMKGLGEKIQKGKPALTIIQKGKQLNIHAPVSGKIKEHNKTLGKKPSLVNSSPYSDGWVYIIEPTNWLKESEFMFMWEKYREWLKGEFSRLRDFLAGSVKPTPEYAHVLQDGGEPKDGILEDLGPEVWEDFQTNFLDFPV